MGANKQTKKLRLTAQAMAWSGVSRPYNTVTPMPNALAMAKASPMLRF
jgi:hypothetical protein